MGAPLQGADTAASAAGITASARAGRSTSIRRAGPRRHGP
jgi:hypothetical protein